MDLVEIEVLRPAEVEFPADIQTIIVIDRAAPKNFGEELLAGVEGLGSAEGLLADQEARDSAISAMKEGLRDSPRFEVIEASVNTRDYGTSIWDVSMQPWEVIDLCVRVQCDGIVSLDAFDSDTSISEVLELAEGIDGENDAAEVIWYELTRTTNTVATWRFYDAYTGDSMDALREHRVGNILDASGATFEEAIAGIPDGRSVVKGLAEQSAEDYASRIAPVYETVYRHLYSTGSEAIEAGSDAFDAGQLEQAIGIWEQCAQSDWSDEKGRCLFNLAVSYESRGDLDTAYVHAMEAHDLLGHTRTLNYVRELASLWQ
jgi:tetratricopeptide (TPR) repeat protein